MMTFNQDHTSHKRKWSLSETLKRKSRKKFDDKFLTVRDMTETCETLENQIKELSEELRSEGKMRTVEVLSKAQTKVGKLKHDLKYTYGLLRNDTSRSRSTSSPFFESSPEHNPVTKRTKMLDTGTPTTQAKSNSTPTQPDIGNEDHYTFVSGLTVNSSSETNVVYTNVVYTNVSLTMINGNQPPISSQSEKLKIVGATSEASPAALMPAPATKPQKKASTPCSVNIIATSKPGSVKPARLKPDPPPKPQGLSLRFPLKITSESYSIKPVTFKPGPFPTPGKHSGIDDSTGDYPNTEDSGFSDSQEFMQNPQWLKSKNHAAVPARHDCVPISNPGYTKLNRGEVQVSNDYSHLMTPNRCQTEVLGTRMLDAGTPTTQAKSVLHMYECSNSMPTQPDIGSEDHYTLVPGFTINPSSETNVIDTNFPLTMLNGNRPPLLSQSEKLKIVGATRSEASPATLMPAPAPKPRKKVPTPCSVNTIATNPGSSVKPARLKPDPPPKPQGLRLCFPYKCTINMPIQPDDGNYEDHYTLPTSVNNTINKANAVYENCEVMMLHGNQPPIPSQSEKLKIVGATSEASPATLMPAPPPKPQKKAPTPCSVNVIATSKPGSVKPARLKPDPPPKPQGLSLRFPLKITSESHSVKPVTFKPDPFPKSRKQRDHSGIDDSMGDYPNTGDSGFSDSQEFMKNPQWLKSKNHAAVPARHDCVPISNPGYTKLNRGEVQVSNDYSHLMTPNRCQTEDNSNENSHHAFNVLSSVSTYYHCLSDTASIPFIGPVEILMCDSLGGEYYSSDHGIILRIPEGAIPPGLIAHLEVAVALYGPFQFPDRSCPISPILWLCIQENISLRKPIDIILPHFLTNINESDIENLGICFTKADHKQYTTRSHYTFRPLTAALIAYKERSQNYGILSTQHCCFFCIISSNPISKEFALKAGYFLWCIEKPFSLSSSSRCRDTIIFCVTFCLPTCIKALKSQYTEKDGYFIRKPKLFRFTDTGDVMDPHLLIKVENDGCVMAADPKNKRIKASQVYFWDDKQEKLELLHVEKVYPPGVMLTLEVLESHPIHIFIKFHGSTADNDMDMEIMLPLENAQSGPSSPTVMFESQWISSDKPELSTLLKELYTKVACKWEDIGILLEIESHSLESLKTAENNTPQSRLREMLKIWLKKINPPPSWSAIADALQCLGEEELAHHLISKKDNAHH